VSAPDGLQTWSRGLATWLARVAPASARGQVTVAIVSDRRMRALNRMFRGRDAVTDVLSFPARPSTDGVRSRPAATTAPGVGDWLGDIVIAGGVAARQAAAHGHSVGVEGRVLALHGLLHLLGYDHEADAGRMARVESRLRRKGGLPTGLIGRSARPRHRR
jgi:probable rRNA maturation factor